MMALARSSVVPALLVALLASTTTRSGVAGGGSTFCDTANCGKGNCVPEPPWYKCECDPGWSQLIPLLHFSPCTVPNRSNCSFDSACFNLSFTLPKGIPTLDPCVAVNCGPGGACVKGDGFSYHCECEPGFVNLLNLTGLPCVKNCAFGMDCSTLGISPPPASPPSPAPSGNHDSSGPTAAPSSPTGSVSMQSLQQLLLLVSLAMVQIM